MATWPIDPSWVSPSQINNGQTYDAADGVTYDDINNIVKNMIYLLNHGGGVTPSGTLNVTSNGTYDVKVYANVEVNVPQTTSKPQLHAPTITLTGSTLTITNPATNGDFVTGYQIVANGSIVATTSASIVNLAQILSAGTYTVLVRCRGTDFVPSLYSNSVTYTKTAGLYPANDLYPGNSVYPREEGD